MKPHVIILCGIPTAGKSTWTKNHLDNNNWETTSISRDAIRESPICFSQPYIYNKANEDRVTQLFDRELAYQAFHKKNIILDNTHCKEFYLDANIKLFSEKYPDYTVYIKFFDIPLWKAYIRTIIRKRKTGKEVPFKVIKAMNKSYKKVNKHKYKKFAL